MRNPLDYVTFRFRDQSNEPAWMRVPLKSGFTALQMDALRLAVWNMSQLTHTGRTNAVDTQDPYAAPAGAREEKYLIRGYDQTNHLATHLSVPGVRSGTVYLPDSDFVDLVNDPFAPALVTALNVIWASDLFDNLVTVQSIERVRGQK